MGAAADGVVRLSGWCMDGHCLPSVVSRGCPGTFFTAPDCMCPCHRGKVPPRAVQVARNDNRREAQRRALADESRQALEARGGPVLPAPVDPDTSDGSDAPEALVTG